MKNLVTRTALHILTEILNLVAFAISIAIIMSVIIIVATTIYTMITDSIQLSMTQNVILTVVTSASIIYALIDYVNKASLKLGMIKNKIHNKIESI